ncbi:MAG: porin [Planctomycetota bacterium]|nr:porin [Planctomycetota bacterium]
MKQKQILKYVTTSWLTALLLLAVLATHTNGQEETGITHPTSANANTSLITPGDTSEASILKEFESLKMRIAELEQEREAAPAGIDPDLRSRLENLESSSERASDLLSGLKSSFDGVVHHGHKSPKLNFFGRIHLDYWGFPQVADEIADNIEGSPVKERWNFRRVRIGIKGDLNDNMLYKYETEFAKGSEKTEYRDLYIGFKNVPVFQTVLIGNQKRPYGLDHLNSSRYNIFIERPFIIEAFNQDARRLGIQSYGISEDLRYNWRFGFFSQRYTQNSEGWKGTYFPGEIAGRWATTFWWDETTNGRGYGHFAVSGSLGDARNAAKDGIKLYRTRPEARSDKRWLDTGVIDGFDPEWSSLFGLEYVLNIGAFQFCGEYLHSNVSRSQARDLQFDGGYFYVAYMLTGEHMPWDRKTGCLARIKPFENFFIVRDCDGCVRRGKGAWQIAARYSKADLTDQDGAIAENIYGGNGHSLTLDVNWYWNPYARMQFNWLVGAIKDRRNPADPNQPLVGPGNGDYDILGARWMVDF